ncbi:MAG: hypothetical protein PCFJNLEI_04145 [Verrucomicrobiae bacterium]|nr:hypothetical protein [Verrucomicrobiae bacterium]
MLNAPEVVPTVKKPPLLIVLVLEPRPKLTVGVKVAPLLMLITAEPMALLWPATSVTPDRVSTVPIMLELLPRKVSVPVPAPVWLVTTKVLPAVSVMLLMIPLTPLPAVATPVLENASVASLDTVTLSNRKYVYAPTPWTSAAKVNVLPLAVKSKLPKPQPTSRTPCAVKLVIVELSNTCTVPPRFRNTLPWLALM